MVASLRPTRREHVADDVFEQLAAAILRGELVPGQPLPPERQLADRFRVSTITIRQAVHRLAELDLVRVRQGAATVVLDPTEASNLGLLDLFYRLAPRGVPGTPDLTDMIEKQYLQGLSMVSVAARRASARSLRELARLVDDFDR